MGSKKRSNAPIIDVNEGRTTSNEGEFGIRPVLRPGAVGEPWPPIFDCQVEFISLQQRGRHEIQAGVRFAGKKTVLILVFVGAILAYATATHHQGVVQHVIQFLEHFK